MGPYGGEGRDRRAVSPGACQAFLSDEAGGVLNRFDGLVRWVGALWPGDCVLRGWGGVIRGYMPCCALLLNRPDVFPVSRES